MGRHQTYLVERIGAVHGAAGAVLAMRIPQWHQLRLAGKGASDVIVAGTLHCDGRVGQCLPVDEAIGVVVLPMRERESY